jgi:predicted nucleic acid-binding protein
LKYWDSSAIVPLCVTESASDGMLRLYRDDPVIITWWGSEIECASAFARLEREGALGTADVSAAMDRVRALRVSWHEVQPSPSVRDTSIRLLRVHPLRAADAVQLSSALIASDSAPATLELVTLDDRLAAAARREGFPVKP